MIKNKEEPGGISHGFYPFAMVWPTPSKSSHFGRLSWRLLLELPRLVGVDKKAFLNCSVANSWPIHIARIAPIYSHQGELNAPILVQNGPEMTKISMFGHVFALSTMQKKETSILKSEKETFCHAIKMLSYLTFEGLSIALLFVVIGCEMTKILTKSRVLTQFPCVVTDSLEEIFSIELRYGF